MNYTPEQFAEAIAKAMGKGVGGSSTRVDVEKDLDAFKKSLENLNKITKQNTVTYGGLAKELLGAKKTYKDLTNQLEHLEEQLEDLADVAGEEAAEKREQLKLVRDQVAKVQDQNLKIRATTEYLTTFGKTLGGSVGIMASAAGNFAKGLQGGTDAFSLAGGVLNAGIDVANTGAQAAGKGLGAMGGVLTNSTNPKMRAVGIAAGIAGSLISGLGDAASAAAKFLVDFLVKEAQKLVEAFNKTSASGAMFADGMTGMSNAAHAAGLTVTQFSNVVSKNSVELAQSGLGVTEGAKKIGSAMAAGGAQMKKELLNMGYGFEEQAELTATTIANMRRTTGGKVSDAEVATQTQKYAENLRTIAAITGEDAKAKVKQAQEQNQILAFQQKVSEMSAEQRAQIDAAMATMTEQEKKNFRDRMVLGTVVNQEGAIYEATVKGAREKGEAALALAKNNQLTAESNSKLNSEYGAQIKDSVMANKGLATAAYVGGGALADVAKSQLDAVNQANTYTEEARENAKKNIEGQKNATDEMTTQLMSAATQAQDMAKQIETLAQKALPKFGEAVNAVIGTINKGLGNKETGAEAGEESKSWLGKKVDGAIDWMKQPGNISGTLQAAGGAAMVGGAAASVTGVGAIGGVPLATIGAVLEGVGMLASVAGFATGGISYGNNESKTGGQLAMVSEGGIAEAHVPLPDGKRIPVELNLADMMAGINGGAGGGDVAKAIENLNSTMSSFMNRMGGTSGSLQPESSTGLTAVLETQFNEMIGHLRDNKDISQKLLNVSM